MSIDGQIVYRGDGEIKLICRQLTFSTFCVVFNCALCFVLAGDDEICTSDECRAKSAQILEKIDDSINP